MTDEEICLTVAEAIGGKSDGAVVEPLGGNQGLIVCRVRLKGGNSYIFKAVREARRQEIAVSRLLAEIANGFVPNVLAADEDYSRGLYWLVSEDLGERRLKDSPSASGYAEAARLLARIQIASLDHLETLSAFGVPQVDVGRWEEIALRLLERCDSLNIADRFLDRSLLEEVIWSASAIARSASMLPSAVVHGDLHSANIALGDGGVRLMDWGSAYIGACFLGLEELLWPSARYLRNPSDADRVRSAYLHEWAPLLGKPGHLESSLLACRALVRMELLLEAMKPEIEPDPYTIAATFTKMDAAYKDWKKN